MDLKMPNSRLDQFDMLTYDVLIPLSGGLPARWIILKVR